MFSSSNIKKYEQVVKDAEQVLYEAEAKKIALLSKQQSIVHICLLKNNSFQDESKLVNPKVFMLNLLKRYHNMLGNKSHIKFAKSLISMLQKKTSEEDMDLGPAFDAISNYIKSASSSFSIRGDFFSLLLVFFRHHPELIHKIKPDTQGICALLLLGVFANDNSSYNYARDGLIKLEERDWFEEDRWIEYFLKNVIPSFSKKLLEEFVEGTIDDSYNFFWAGLTREPLPYQVPLLKLLVNSKILPPDLYKKVLKTLSVCQKDFKENKIISSSEKNIEQNNPWEAYHKDLLYCLLNKPKLAFDYFKRVGSCDMTNPLAIPQFFQTLKKDQQEILLNNLITGYECTHHFTIRDALIKIQYLFPEYENHISSAMISVAEIEARQNYKHSRIRHSNMNDNCKSEMAKIYGEKIIVTFLEKEKDAKYIPPVHLCTGLPNALISIIISYLVIDSYEKYVYELPSNGQNISSSSSSSSMILSSLPQNKSEDELKVEYNERTSLTATNSVPQELPKLATQKERDEVRRIRFLASYDARSSQVKPPLPLKGAQNERIKV